MTSWLTVAFFLSLGAATGWWITRRWIIPADTPPRWPDDWDDLTREQKLAWLRHPSHRPRCVCGRYGIPTGGHAILDTYDGEDWQHCEHACQPMREAL